MEATTRTIALLAARGDWGPHGGGGWWVGPIVAIVGLVVVATLVWLLLRRGDAGRTDGVEHARALLAERYANGDLSTDEYRERLQHLR